MLSFCSQINTIKTYLPTFCHCSRQVLTRRYNRTCFAGASNVAVSGPFNRGQEDLLSAGACAFQMIGKLAGFHPEPREQLPKLIVSDGLRPKTRVQRVQTFCRGVGTAYLAM